MTDRENESSSAAVKRPQQPKEILETTYNIKLKVLVVPIQTKETKSKTKKQNVYILVNFCPSLLRLLPRALLMGSKLDDSFIMGMPVHEAKNSF